MPKTVELDEAKIGEYVEATQAVDELAAECQRLDGSIANLRKQSKEAKAKHGNMVERQEKAAKAMPKALLPLLQKPEKKKKKKRNGQVISHDDRIGWATRFVIDATEKSDSDKITLTELNKGYVAHFDQPAGTFKAHLVKEPKLFKLTGEGREQFVKYIGPT